MDMTELKYFREEMEKTSFYRRMLRKLFTRTKEPFKNRIRQAGSNLDVSGTVIGGLAIGGTGYSALKHKPPLSKAVLNRGY